MTYLYTPNAQKDRLVISVHSEKGNRVFNNYYPSFTEDAISGELTEDLTLIELGVMSSVNDIEGLRKHLVDIEILQPGDSLQLKR